MNTKFLYRKIGILAGSLLILSTTLGHQDAQAANRYAFATAGQGGTYHILGAAVTDLINNNSDKIQLTATSTSGANANMPLIDSGQMKMGMGASPSDMAAFNGTAPFTKTYTNLRTMMVGYVNPGTFVVRADSDIHKVEDFRDKRISMPMGGTSRTVMTTLLSAYGLEAEKDYTIIPINFSQAVEALQNERIDVSMQWAAPPSPAMMQMAELFPIRMIPIESEEAIAAVKDKLGVVPYTYKAQVYKGIEEPVPAVAMLQSFLAHKDVPDDEVQDFLRIVTENTAALAKSHPIGSQLNMENAVRALDYPIPPHPGAIEFFKAKGLVK
ncbi:TRAP transporter solute receptor, TAXI family [Pusillimonas sp. T7-7]|uniref:TAXI family TRAP transporter solute-binding subunit n=1 Tax=Pusillimonas sp. (strain T7-7) TaxID=1007105 RepID=UPI00020847B3|nr:TAXI family TRAP transporter solute-binding subunit [Pusillimonas sp. T7-7]AEC21579.1 TRAP transporter solute receptor, TAXI family [Pusillimonas sp. T7-7]